MTYEPRWVAIWLARETTCQSLPTIGRAFGGRDHTTIMHALAGIDAQMAKDGVFAARLIGMRHALDGSAMEIAA